ncbi:unnamed protein product [Hydatigera taeniaeformis]|uniref:Breast cancer type 2 susceptibility protein homolog n=1 Tax=Hydatigena taeniaeformis TaxID=6205 RepID=A0A0R3WJJ4_HYDTA|nr:unnamed protein product [Hydatigera taeniaeformis]
MLGGLHFTSWDTNRPKTAPVTSSPMAVSEDACGILTSDDDFSSTSIKRNPFVNETLQSISTKAGMSNTAQAGNWNPFLMEMSGKSPLSKNQTTATEIRFSHIGNPRVIETSLLDCPEHNKPSISIPDNEVIETYKVEEYLDTEPAHSLSDAEKSAANTIRSINEVNKEENGCKLLIGKLQSDIPQSFRSASKNMTSPLLKLNGAIQLSSFSEGSAEIEINNDDQGVNKEVEDQNVQEGIHSTTAEASVLKGFSNISPARSSTLQLNVPKVSTINGLVGEKAEAGISRTSNRFTFSDALLTGEENGAKFQPPFIAVPKDCAVLVIGPNKLLTSLQSNVIQHLKQDSVSQDLGGGPYSAPLENGADTLAESSMSNPRSSSMFIIQRNEGDNSLDQKKILETNEGPMSKLLEGSGNYPRTEIGGSKASSACLASSPEKPTITMATTYPQANREKKGTVAGEGIQCVSTVGSSYFKPISASTSLQRTKEEPQYTSLKLERKIPDTLDASTSKNPSVLSVYNRDGIERGSLIPGFGPMGPESKTPIKLPFAPIREPNVTSMAFSGSQFGGLHRQIGESQGGSRTYTKLTSKLSSSISARSSKNNRCKLAHCEGSRRPLSPSSFQIGERDDFTPLASQKCRPCRLIVAHHTRSSLLHRNVPVFDFGAVDPEIYMSFTDNEDKKRSVVRYWDKIFGCSSNKAGEQCNKVSEMLLPPSK